MRSGGGCMTQFYYEKDADLAAIEGQTVAVVGYGNQGRPWALNLRDSGLNPQVCVRNDDTRAQARKDGFATGDINEAQQADIVCILVPDDVIPQLALERGEDQLTILASGYSYAFKRFSPAGDQAMIAPRMLGPEVRNCFVEGAGFITALGIERDVTGTALQRTLAVAKALGGLREVSDSEPVCHLSYYEADAFARFCGKRLPSEQEWEIAADNLAVDGNFVDESRFHPTAGAAAPNDGDGLAGLDGEVDIVQDG